jgi:hypothetical protein
MVARIACDLAACVCVGGQMLDMLKQVRVYTSWGWPGQHWPGRLVRQLKMEQPMLNLKECLTLLLNQGDHISVAALDRE